jgi:hypothetical protein
MYACKLSVVWEASLSDIVLKMMVELVSSMVSYGLIESQMQKIVNDVLDFTGITTILVSGGRGYA